MLELLLLISGLVALWKFSASTSAVSQGAETKAQVWAESVIAEATIERQENYKEFKEATKDMDKIVSHESFMKELRGE
jgi:hypothetical protein